MEYYSTSSFTKINNFQQNEKEKLLTENLSLKKIINDAEERFKYLSENFEKQSDFLREKLKEKTDLIFVLDKELENMQNKIEEMKNLEKAESNVQNLMKNVQTLNGFLNKIDESKVFLYCILDKLLYNLFCR